MFVKGHNGQIEFDGTSVKIMRKGAMALLSQGLKGEKSIPVGAIVSVQFKDASMLTNGFIQFATGAGESKGGLFSAGDDENSVIFTTSHKKEFAELRAAVEKAMNEGRQNNGTAAKADSPLDGIKKLKELLDLGAISQEEFESEKSKLMGQL
jgi:hypothetical protein